MANPHRNIMRTLLLPLFLALAAVPAASAQPSQQPFFNVVTIEASATADVPTDALTVTLFVEEQGPDPAALATRVYARLEEALARAKKEPKVEAHSGDYQTTPVYDRANQITGWRIRADVVLESRDFKAAAALAGALQPALKLGSMTFSLSRQARETAEAALLTEALGKFQEKARAVAKGLGFPGYQLGQIVVRNEGSVPPPVRFRAMAMSASADGGQAAPVPAEGGKNAVTVVVSGSVVLGPGK
jgi:predicted secreted protein